MLFLLCSGRAILVLLYQVWKIFAIDSMAKTGCLCKRKSPVYKDFKKKRLKSLQNMRCILTSTNHASRELDTGHPSTNCMAWVAIATYDNVMGVVGVVDPLMLFD